MRPCKHKTIPTILLVAIAAFLVALKCAVGVPIYSQVLPEEPVGAFTSLNGSQKIANNFMLDGPGPITVRSLRFIGGATGMPTLAPPDDFRIVFLDDNGGTPGTPLPGGDFAIGSAYSRTPTSGRLLNGVTVPFDYVINLSSEIILNSDTEYWISVTNDLLPDSGWVWARASENLGSTISTTTNDVGMGSWTISSSGGGMFFELDNQYVPESTSIALFLIALTPTAWIRRRRNPV